MDRLREITKKLNTPAYIFDERQLKEQFDLIRANISPKVGVCFAMKANPFLVGISEKYADCIEVCSPGEYEICIRNNIPSEKIIVSGVNKTEESMERILDYSGGAGIYTIESPKHYEILCGLAKDKGLSMRVIIRLSSGNQFGVDEETWLDIAKKIVSDKSLKLIGLHYYSGTQKKMSKIKKELDRLDDFALKIKEETGISELLLEYGPGLLVSYFDDAEDENSSEQLKELSSLIEDIENYSSVTLEMGRFPASYCGFYFTEIVDIKIGEKGKYIIVDGGIHQLNYYGQMLGMKHPYIEHIKNSTAQEDQREKYTICGSLCTVNDVLVRDYELSSPKVGDLLCFKRCGAYSVTEGMALFLSRELPEVRVCDIDNNVKIVREIKQINTLNS